MVKHFLPDIFGRSAGGDMFSSLQREIDQVFRDFGRGWPAVGGARNGFMAVKFDVAETDKAVEMTADMPGIDVNDISIELKDGVLTIKGEKKADKEEKDKNYHLVERSYGMFERSFTLGVDVESDKVEASFDKGVLKIVLPKVAAVQAKAKKIEVKPAA